MTENEKREDWISSFLRYTAQIPSPKIFRQWTAISLIAGVLERRVWAVTAGSAIYPNLYTVLVSAPGVGKSQAIDIAHDLWNRVPDLPVAPNNVTKASLLDTLEKSRTYRMLSSTQAIEYHAMAIAASEFGVFVPAHDLEFLSSLNYIFDCPASYKENRRTTKKELSITNPMLNILAGTQPAYLANLLPETAWGMGFTSRLILVYSGEPVTVELFDVEELNPKHKAVLLHDLNMMHNIYGKFEFAPDARILIKDWNDNGRDPVPEHSKLQHYNARRIMHLLKLCMISSISRHNTLIVEAVDVHRAMAWLFEAEAHMPDIFRAMVLRSDQDLLSDLHFFMWQMYTKTKRPIHESRLYAFLQAKVPAERIPRIIETAVASNMIVKEIGENTYVPKAKTLDPS